MLRATRDKARVKRTGMILARATIEPKVIDGDEIEEMMRVAMELSEQDMKLLGELVRIEGTMVAQHGRINRYSAHTAWEKGYWGAHLDPEIYSVFSKLESYGLVARISPPNYLNITADFQNTPAALVTVTCST
jgi:hypothetical protein